MTMVKMTMTMTMTMVMMMVVMFSNMCPDFGALVGAGMSCEENLGEMTHRTNARVAPLINLVDGVAEVREPRLILL